MSHLFLLVLLRLSGSLTARSRAGTFEPVAPWCLALLRAARLRPIPWERPAPARDAAVGAQEPRRGPPAVTGW